MNWLVAHVIMNQAKRKKNRKKNRNKINEGNMRDDLHSKQQNN